MEFCKNNFLLGISQHLLLVPVRTTGPCSLEDQRNEKYFTQKSEASFPIPPNMQGSNWHELRRFFSAHKNLFCRFGVNVSFTSSLYSQGSEIWKSEGKCPRSTRKETADPSLEFMSLSSQCITWYVSKRHFPIKIPTKNKTCVKKMCFLTESFQMFLPQ